MNDSPESLRNLLKNVTAQIDLDLAVTIADVLNLYTAALRRNANRSILGPEDAVKILHIINQIMGACEQQDPELIPGAPTKRAPSSNSPV